LEQRRQELLPVDYFHVVFTLPHTLSPLALANKSVVYDLLFRAAWETLRVVAADPRHLGADIGLLAVLHTWGQKLQHHPHLHGVVPAGGLALDGSRWVSCRPGFFLPVRVLSRVFRGKFLAGLRRAYEQGKLVFSRSVAGLANAAAFARLLDQSSGIDWGVYAQPALGGPEVVLKYLARYVHRTALAHDRLVALEGGRVTFTWKDYTDGCRHQTLTLEAAEFLRRFCLHLTPPGFRRIRHFGLLANRRRRHHLARCRELLVRQRLAESAAPPPPDPRAPPAPPPCPHCGSTVWVLVAELPRWSRYARRALLWGHDTS
jgi:Putative transposase